MVSIISFLAGCGIRLDGFFDDTPKPVSVNLKSSEKFSVDQIQEIQVKVGAQTVHLFNNDENEIVVGLNQEDKGNLKTEVSGNRLSVSMKDKVVLGANLDEPPVLQIGIPKNQLNKIQLNIDSGALSVDQVEAKQLDIINADGGTLINGFKGDLLTIDAETGSVTANQIAAPFQIKKSDGSVKLSLLDGLIGDNSVKVSTGSVTITNHADQESIYVDLLAKIGRIKSNYPISASTNDDDRSQYKGWIGSSSNGAPKLKVQVSDGTITFNK